MLNGVIVESDKKDAVNLQSVLNQLQPNLVCTVFSTGREVLEYVRRGEAVDIFFIARELPDMDSFSLLSRIRQSDPHILAPVVFVTDDEMGSQLHYRYLLKPVSQKSVKSNIGALLETLGQQKRPQRQLKRIIRLTVDGDTRLMEAQSILGLETEGKNCYVYAGQNRHRILRQTIDKTLKEIGEPYCIRCHKSFALNLRNVVDIKKDRRNIWIPIFAQKTEFQCEISKTHYEEVMKQYHHYLSGN